MTENGAFKIYKELIIYGLICLFSMITLQQAYASDGGDGQSFNPGDMINHHIKDAHGWEITHGVVVPLPVILYSELDGLVIFSSANFFNEAHQEVPYMGYVLAHEHISRADGQSVFDFSITKNVLFIFIDAAIMLLVFFAVARGYKKNVGKAPKGVQSLFEPVIIYIRDDEVESRL